MGSSGCWVPQSPDKKGNAYDFMCSNCGMVVWSDRKQSVEDLGYRYCPFCGARMISNEYNMTNICK